MWATRLTFRWRLVAHLWLASAVVLMLLPVSFLTLLVWYTTLRLWLAGLRDAASVLIAPLVLCYFLEAWFVVRSYTTWRDLLIERGL